VQRANEVAERRRQNFSTIPSTLSLELATNPFLRATAPEIIDKARQLLGHEPRDATEVFTAIRQARNNFR
jgi:hydroxyacylglutathione hydrolase